MFPTKCQRQHDHGMSANIMFCQSLDFSIESAAKILIFTSLFCVFFVSLIHFTGGMSPVCTIYPIYLQYIEYIYIYILYIQYILIIGLYILAYSCHISRAEFLPTAVQLLFFFVSHVFKNIIRASTCRLVSPLTTCR